MSNGAYTGMELVHHGTQVVSRSTRVLAVEPFRIARPGIHAGYWPTAVTAATDDHPLTERGIDRSVMAW